MNFVLRLALFFCIVMLLYCEAGTKSKPHSNEGLLEPYDGFHIPYTITAEQNALLDKGQPVTWNERSGKSGRGVALQDVEAEPHICMNRISDLSNYPTMVPKVTKVDVFEEEKLLDGKSKVGAEFAVSVWPLTFTYFLKLLYEPKYQTLTWTLDYKYLSDFEDSVGHWQVMPHPTKKGWTRVLYSTQVQLLPWIPEFVITFLTKTALIEATTWVRKESEKLSSSSAAKDIPVIAMPDLSTCFTLDEDGAHYSTACMMAAAAEHTATGSAADLDSEGDTSVETKEEL